MGKTIMISSHILSELAEICDHVGIIEQGHLVFSGTLDDIRRQMGLHSKFRVQVDPDREAQAVETLRALPQVADVTRNNTFLSVTLADGVTDEGLIARTLVGEGFGLRALVPEELKLDDAFLHLTKGAVQ